MGFYQFKRTQKIPATVDEVWDFISSPANLQEITPDHMGFEITSGDLPEKMYPGMIISYVVKPLMGIPMTWVTEITQVIDKSYFIDEQRVGPYKIWHHQHFIEPIEGGVLMRDIVSYQPPLGILGSIMNSLVIRKKLEEIFNYRVEAVDKRFGAFK
ncbi:SRPBCC family protein [Gilvibacter sp.]|uniref:SRPBCC family protein n=1 Tax=Gilvibacter sp. TaxID=2729997 RepID=UPI0025BCEB1F|nr:SRPBCC family protein [Gilvibacter sp.]NQX78782.1 SRPBCC family protein [Gilvibacter sp.]